VITVEFIDFAFNLYFETGGRSTLLQKIRMLLPPQDQAGARIQSVF
jgi:hypothetical protein